MHDIEKHSERDIKKLIISVQVETADGEVFRHDVEALAIMGVVVANSDDGDGIEGGLLISGSMNIGTLAAIMEGHKIMGKKLSEFGMEVLLQHAIGSTSHSN